MIKIIDGDLIKSNAPFIAHQVNCQGAMNSGVAKQIRKCYPVVYDYYMLHFNTGQAKLGAVQVCPVKSDKSKCVCNLFAQDRYGYDGKQYTSIDALKQCFTKLNQLAAGATVAMPYKIGCVRGGADWDVVLEIIKDTFTLCDVELWRLDKG